MFELQAQNQILNVINLCNWYYLLFFKNMGQSWPLFHLFWSFSHSNYNFNNANWKIVDGLLGFRTRGRKMVVADETTELWRLHYCLLFVYRNFDHIFCVFGRLKRWQIWVRFFLIFWPLQWSSRSSWLIRDIVSNLVFWSRQLNKLNINKTPISLVNCVNRLLNEVIFLDVE